MLEIARLARARHRSAGHYRAMQAHIAARSLGELARRGIDLAACDVLELAAGEGGYAEVLHRAAGSYLASDLGGQPFFRQAGIPFAVFDVMRPFPLGDGSFDLIYCSSLVEHVPDPARLLAECRRVLRPDGWLYLSFPPFYSLALVGGHGFKPYHLLGERLALRIYNRRHGTGYQSYAEVGNNLSLYPRTIAEVAGCIRAAGFELVDTYTRMSALNTARLPGVLKDLATWHVCYLARKGR